MQKAKKHNEDAQNDSKRIFFVLFMPKKYYFASF